MKVEIDWRPKKEDSSAFYGIRLYPETNEEMADLERFIGCRLEPEEFLRIVNGNAINYLIRFENEEKK